MILAAPQSHTLDPWLLWRGCFYLRDAGRDADYYQTPAHLTLLRIIYFLYCS